MSHVRVFHGMTDGPPVDVYFNNRMMGSHIAHGGFTDYEEFEPGDYSVSVYYAGRHDYPVYTTSVTIPLSSIYTCTLSGYFPRIVMLPVCDSCNALQPTASNVCVRFVHLSHDCGTLDVSCDSCGSILWPSCDYGYVSDYVHVYPGTHTFYFNRSGTSSTILTVPNATLTPNRYYTVYAAGSMSHNDHTLRAHIPLDGGSYIHYQR